MFPFKALSNLCAITKTKPYLLTYGWHLSAAFALLLYKRLRAFQDVFFFFRSFFFFRGSSVKIKQNKYHKKMHVNMFTTSLQISLKEQNW